MLGLLLAFPYLLLLSLLGPSSGSDDDGTVVLTTSGPIRGKLLQVGSSTVTAFLGIPYAEPPVGALRFQKPIPHQPWGQILEATSFSNDCLQSPLTGYPEAETWTPKMPQSEDCLFLNIWVPHPRPNDMFPMIVWIHGGGFFSGAASLDVHDGRLLAATGNMIVASMNYQLGGTGLPVPAPGRPGEHRPVGPATGDVLAVKPAPLHPRSAAEQSPKRTMDTALVGCLQGKEAREFPKHQFSVLLHKDLLAFPFVPTPDWDFLPDTPPRLLQARHNQPMPIVAGFTANEGSYMLIYGAPNLNLENASNVGWEELLQVVRLMVPEAPELAIRAVAERYCKEGEGQGEARDRWAMDQIAGDYPFVCPVAEVARREAEARSPVYAYYFTHRTSGLSTPEWTGVPYGSGLPYLFGTLASVGEANHTHTEAEATMSQTMMQYCGKFAGSKDPQRDRGQWEAMAPLQPHKAELLSHRTGAAPSQGDSPCAPLHVLGNTAHIEAEPYCTKRPLVHRDLHRLQGEQTQEDMSGSGGCE
ncbi:unnamed protein product [Caretta caretta]